MASEIPEFEQALSELERSLLSLRDRYIQVKRDQQRQVELKNRIEVINEAWQHRRSQELRQELKHLETELETLELNLESQLFTWGSLREPFWQAVRFGGLGVVIGWLLKLWAG
ncbi:MAG: DUF2203 domain-containing protein [Oscillatoriales cyanobacterium RM2_1_1]|nr:DUF2203 domain-containing protein [Oscillatoriales cyanobacterium SM2_3_0]NJO44991.1 DUF2203 domain-containing protein [Oscillatoriales cyanobacterium RM2_1_1]